MSSIKLTADSGGGTFEVKAPSSSANTRVLTLPDTGNATILTTDTSVGKILQVVQTVKNDVYNADVAEGAYGVDVPGLTVSITPSNASNKILVNISVTVCFQDSTPTRMAATLFKGGSVISGAIGDASGNINRVSFSQEIANYHSSSTISGEYLDTAGSTNATTYSVRLSHGHNGTKSVFVNRASSSAESNHGYHHRSISTITVMEVSV